MVVAVGTPTALPSAAILQTAMGEIEGRPAPVSRRHCIAGANAGQLCNEDGDCPGSTCQDRNVFNLSVSVRFNATAGQLATIRNAIEDGADLLFDATDGQAQIGQVTILNNSTGNRGHIWVTSAGGCVTDTGTFGTYTGGNIAMSIGSLAGASGAGCVAHEFAHFVFDVRDEYETRAAGCGAVGGAANCPAVASGDEACLMECCGRIGTEFCWGHANPANLADLSGGNHDPSLVTEQSRCRSNRSCWDQIGWSWPNTFLVPPGAPDEGSGGNAINPVVFVQPPSNARIVLVLDTSGSMSAESPTRLDRLKTAALDFVDLAESGVELGIVSFSTNAVDEVPIAALGADRSAYTTAINDLAPLGATNIGDGLQHARDMILAAGGVTAQTSIILMTDGINNRPLGSAAADLQAKIDTLLADGIPVYVTCTGSDVGLDSQCSEIATGTNGTYVDSAASTDMSEVFADFYELTRGRHPVKSQTGMVAKAQQTYTVQIETGARAATFAVLWKNAKSSLALTVTDPKNVSYRGVGIPQGQYLRVPRPVNGTWTVRIAPVQVAETNEEYVSRVYVDNQNVNVPGAVLKTVVKQGEPFLVRAYPHYQGPLLGVRITGVVTKPDGKTAAIRLLDDGSRTSGDEIPNDGTYSARFTDTEQRGAYMFRLDTSSVNAKPVEADPKSGGVAVVPVDFIRETRFSATVDDRTRQSTASNGSAMTGSQLLAAGYLLLLVFGGLARARRKTSE
jgi:hypothetical protein